MKPIDKNKDSESKMKESKQKRPGDMEQNNKAMRFHIDLNPRINTNKAGDTMNVSPKDSLKPINEKIKDVMRDRGDSDRTRITKTDDYKHNKINSAKKDRKPKTPKDTQKINTTNDDAVNESSFKQNIKQVIKSAKVTKKKSKTKAVTFMDQKKNSLIPIQIKIPIPTNLKRTKIPKLIKTKVKSAKSGTSIKDIPLRRNRTEQIKPEIDISSEFSKCVVDSPPTGVSESPSSIAKHAKQYYEAWVNTTYSKPKNKQALMIESAMIETLKKAKREVNPELVYKDFSDERYTGRIRVHHR